MDGRGASKSILSHLFPFESQMFFEHSLITRTVFIIKELIVMIIVMIIIVIIIIVIIIITVIIIKIEIY